MMVSIPFQNQIRRGASHFVDGFSTNWTGRIDSKVRGDTRLQAEDLEHLEDCRVD